MMMNITKLQTMRSLYLKKKKKITVFIHCDILPVFMGHILYTAFFSLKFMNAF